MLSVARLWRPGYESLSAVPPRRFDDDVARGRRWQPPSPIAITLNGTMPPSTRRPGRRFAQYGDIADAVLQAADEDIGRSMSRNEVGHLACIRAFDRDSQRGTSLKNG